MITRHGIELPRNLFPVIANGIGIHDAESSEDSTIGCKCPDSQVADGEMMGLDAANIRPVGAQTEVLGYTLTDVDVVFGIDCPNHVTVGTDVDATETQVL